ncbi:MAG: serine/threonine protein phosphatase, partial [Frankiales bacterium]|nr:serine/threonine protein phosphatase [Frankiales bacterium]
MQGVQRRADEHDRERAVQQLGLLDTLPEGRFDRITEAASRLLGMPVSTISLISGERHWNKSRHGDAPEELPRDVSLCDHVVAADAPLLVPDVRADPRFAELPHPGLRTYAGQPLHSLSGQPVGALCVHSDVAVDLTPHDLEVLATLAEWAQAELRATEAASSLDQVLAEEEQLRAVLDSAPAGVLLVGGDERVVWASGPAQLVFGDAVGQPLSALLPDADVRELAGGRRAGDAGAAGLRVIRPGERADGTRFP